MAAGTNSGDDDLGVAAEQKIRLAVERQLERDARTRRNIGILIGAAFVVSIVVLLLGTGERAQIETSIKQDTQFTSAVAETLAQEPAVANAVANADSVRAAVSQQVQVSLADDSVIDSLVTSDQVQQQLSAAADTAVTTQLSGAAAQAEILRAASAATAPLQRQLETQQAELASIRNQQADERLNAVIDRIEQLESQVLALGGQAGGGESGVTFPDVVDLQADLDDLRQALAAISGNAIRTGSAVSRSYLLKERATNALSDVRLSISIGNERDGIIENVVIVDAAGRSVLPERQTVRLGEFVEFETDAGQRYSLVFPYSQSRFFAKDYVGLELTQLNADAADR